MAEQTEEAIFQEIKNTESTYKSRVRSRVLNLKDKKNSQLRENVLTGQISPKRLASMNSEVSNIIVLKCYKLFDLCMTTGNGECGNEGSQRQIHQRVHR